MWKIMVSILIEYCELLGHIYTPHIEFEAMIFVLFNQIDFFLSKKRKKLLRKAIFFVILYRTVNDNVTSEKKNKKKL